VCVSVCVCVYVCVCACECVCLCVRVFSIWHLLYLYAVPGKLLRNDIRLNLSNEPFQ
jgi:hypothetical protein